MENTNTVVMKRRSVKTDTMVKIAMLSALGCALMFIDPPLPIFPFFLKLDISDIPAVIGTFSMGPLAGVAIQLVKNILHCILKTSTFGIGEIANFVVGSAFVLPLGIIYKRYKGTGAMVVSLALSTLFMTVVAGVFNYVFLIPAFAKLYGAPIETFVDTARAINPNVVDLKTLVMLSVMPFNLLKGTIVSIISLLAYKVLKPALHLGASREKHS